MKWAFPNKRWLVPTRSSPVDSYAGHLYVVTMSRHCGHLGSSSNIPLLIASQPLAPHHTHSPPFRTKYEHSKIRIIKASSLQWQWGGHSCVVRPHCVHPHRSVLLHYPVLLFCPGWRNECCSINDHRSQMDTNQSEMNSPSRPTTSLAAGDKGATFSKGHSSCPVVRAGRPSVWEGDRGWKVIMMWL